MLKEKKKWHWATLGYNPGLVYALVNYFGERKYKRRCDTKREQLPGLPGDQEADVDVIGGSLTYNGYQTKKEGTHCQPLHRE